MKTEVRPQPEVDAEVKRLQELLELVPERDYFGTSNINKIEAAIAVIEDFMDEDDIYEMEETGEWDESQVQHALDMLAWLNGDESESPSSGWEPLVNSNQSLPSKK